MQSKRCSSCRNMLPCDRFGRDRSKPDGLEARCRACRSAHGAATRVRKGRPTSMPRAQKYRPGHRFAALTLVERLGIIRGSVYLLCRCDCGNEKRLALQNLSSGATKDCADRSRHPDPRTQEGVSYSGAHGRIRAARGSASLYRCRCGKQAEHWAYLHSDYAERQDAAGKEAGRPYSADPAHYTPLCRTCHGRWDGARRNLPVTSPSLAHVAVWMASANSRPPDTFTPVPHAFGRQVGR